MCRDVVSKAAKIISMSYPKINVCGRHNGYFPIVDEIEIVDEINNRTF